MRLPVSAAYEYDARQDLTVVTSGSEYFANPVVTYLERGSVEDERVRDVLEDRGLLDLSDFESATKLGTLDDAGKFGVYGDGSESAFSVDSVERLAVVGGDGSGIVNFARLWLLWAAHNQAKVFYFGDDDDLFGADRYLPSVISYDPEDDDDLGTFLSNYDDSYSADSDGVVRFAPALLIADLRGVEDTDAFVEVYKEFNETRGNGVLRKVRVLILLDEDQASTTIDLEDDSLAVGFIGSIDWTRVESVSFNQPTPPHENARGVLWITGGNLPMEGWSRINTYLVPKNIWRAPVYHSHTLV